jgi:hypothetical protein
MAMLHRPWTDDEIAKLRSLAGRLTPEEIAKEIGRTRAATTIKAHELHLSLRRPGANRLDKRWVKSSMLG